ncbi:MAG: competence protein ComEC [Chloroflexota bacterium]|nr:competence protein ComEC [Chloroflexota bacterium]
MVGLLAGWCAGLLAGQTALAPGAAPALFAVGGMLGALSALLKATGCPSTRSLLPVAWLAAALLGTARGASAVHVVAPGTLDAHLGRHVTFTGTVSRASGTAAFQSLWVGTVVIPGDGPVSGTAQVTARSAIPVVPGSVVEVSGTLERLPGRAADGTTGYDDRMQREGVLAAIPGAAIRLVRPPPTLSIPAMAWRARTAVAAAVRGRVPEPEATVGLGALVGIRGKLPVPVESDLVGSGLVHLLAVSGLKVALVAGTLGALLRRAGRPAAALAIVGVFAYALVGGASSAAVRSAIMGSLALVAQVLRRDVDPVRGLLLAATLMLGHAPALAGDLSFQYSFLGVAGIQVLSRGLDRRLSLLPRPFREALAVSLAAQVATLPLTAANFHVISVAGPVANMLAVPALPAGMAAAGWAGAGMPDPFGVVAAIAGGLAAGLLALAHAAVALPAGVVGVPWFGLPHALAYYSAAACAAFTHHAGGGRRLALGGAAAAATVVLLLGSWPDGRMHLVLLATPGGGALITAPDGARMLVDTGTSPAALAAELDARLAPPDPRLDAVLLTGASPSAAGGIAGLGRRVPGLFLLPPDSGGGAPLLVARAMSAHGAVVRPLVPGDRFGWHGLWLETGDCGDGLSVSVTFGRSLAWICTAGTAATPGTVPTRAGMVVDIGAGRVLPDGSLAPAAWVVEHPIGSAVVPRVPGARTWRTSRDGALDLACDGTTCE